MDLYEYQGKRLFAEAGIPVARARLATSIAEAREVAREIGLPLVVKAQVLGGGRGKAGGVRMAADEMQLVAAARDILEMTIQDRPVAALLVEEAVAIERELYLAVTLDRHLRCPVLLFSVRGGVDIEEVARAEPQALLSAPIDPLTGVGDDQVELVVSAATAGMEGGVAQALGAGVGGAKAPGASVDDAQALGASLGDVVRRVWELYRSKDATLVEINPLVVCAGSRVLALDAKVSLDDNAEYRHPEMEERRGAQDERERRAAEAGVKYVSLDGDVGVLGNGAGLVMSTLDLIAGAGGRPANFCDVGGGAQAQQVAAALAVILSDARVRAVLVNIFGGLTRGDEVARGLLDALAAAGATLPVVVRLDGNQAEQGRALIAAAELANVVAAADADEAVERVVAAVNGGVAGPGPGSAGAGGPLGGRA
jgi:succinyl-CoA synthetase beta subunit